MQKGDKLFIVDLNTVSFFDKERLKNIATNEKEYFNIPFLYLVSSYMKNSVLDIAQDKLSFIEKKSCFSWDIYSFRKIN